MKRIERNTFNSIKKNLTTSTINVEVPVEYSHEARQAIHEYLTNKGMRVTGINWNSIQECYCIHWERAYTETAEAIRQQQENTDIDNVTEGMEYSDWTWNGYRKPAEAPETAKQEQTEEQTAEAAEDATAPTKKPTHAAPAKLAKHYTVRTHTNRTAYQRPRLNDYGNRSNSAGWRYYHRPTDDATQGAGTPRTSNAR